MDAKTIKKEVENGQTTKRVSGSEAIIKCLLA